ncbi:uncharacterized protein LOC134779754 [Penaeus indicus]|uniref:uncharacterized protein LOC134779754 n=1 Tax=Penaeus indicus TaxID=29960 RepID=UPI00300CF8BB
MVRRRVEQVAHVVRSCPHSGAALPCDSDVYITLCNKCSSANSVKQVIVVTCQSGTCVQMLLAGGCDSRPEVAGVTTAMWLRCHRSSAPVAVASSPSGALRPLQR